MSKLLISKKELKSNTILDGNLDENKFLQFVKIAQDTYLQQYLGTDLLDKMLTYVGGTFASPYDTLLTFVKPVLIQWSIVKYLPFASYQVSNGGVHKHTSENSENPTKDEVDSLVDEARNIAQAYTDRLIEHLCANSTDYPEYSTNSNGDVKPTKEAYFTGWVM